MYEVISQYRFPYTLGVHLNQFTKIGGQNEYPIYAISIDKKSVITNYICFFTIFILHLLLTGYT
jgi:hypothetical protein